MGFNDKLSKSYRFYDKYEKDYNTNLETTYLMQIYFIKILKYCELFKEEYY